MKQRLGKKKISKIEKFTGKEVLAAFTRGGWPHFWAEVFYKDEVYTFSNPPTMVNYKTGEINKEGNPLLRTIASVFEVVRPKK